MYWPAAAAVRAQRSPRGSPLRRTCRSSGRSPRRRPSAGRRRAVVALAGDRHEAAHALDDEVVAGAVAIRTGLAEAGDRAVDQAACSAPTASRSRARSFAAGRPCSSRPAHRHCAPAAARGPGPRRARCRSSPSACRGWPRGSRPPRRVSRPAASRRNGGPQPRVSSPLPGRSTLMTSAPRSASSLRAPGSGEHARQIEHAQVSEGRRHGARG